MMRKTIVAVVAALPLAGCQTTLQTLATGGIPQATLDKISQVQNYAAAFCNGIVPTIETVAMIIKQNDPKLATVEAIGAAICAAVAPPPAAARGLLITPLGTPMVDGVPIVLVKK